MQTLATLSKYTKTGVSVWYFVKTPTGYSAFGGSDPAAYEFQTLEELRALYKRWLSYGFTDGILPAKARKTPRPRKIQAPIADPWESKLPLSMQLELAALA